MKQEENNAKKKNSVRIFYTENCCKWLYLDKFWSFGVETESCWANLVSVHYKF